MFKWLFSKKKRKSNVTIIPTVVNMDGIWASDYLVKPENVPDDMAVVRVEAGTKIGEWTCDVTGFYPWKLIKGYREGTAE